jgi:hypothetical protein
VSEFWTVTLGPKGVAGSKIYTFPASTLGGERINSAVDALAHVERKLQDELREKLRDVVIEAPRG